MNNNIHKAIEDLIENYEVSINLTERFVTQGVAPLGKNFTQGSLHMLKTVCNDLKDIASQDKTTKSDDLSGIISESERLRLMKYIVNGKSVDEIHDFTTLLMMERERTAYSSDDMKEAYKLGHDDGATGGDRNEDRFLDEYER